MRRIKADDLKEIRRQMAMTNAIRGGKAAAEVTVHAGACGIAAGARDLTASILEEIRMLKTADILVTQADCPGLCEHEPLVTVERQGEQPVRYVKMDAQKIKRVIREHAVEGHPVNEWRLAQDKRQEV